MHNIHGFILMAAAELESSAKILDAINPTDADLSSITTRQNTLAKKLRAIAKYMRPSKALTAWDRGTGEAMQNLNLKLNPPNN